MAWSTKKVSEIVDDAVAHKLSVPEFQREFVWDNGKVRDLIDSLFRDYPVGQFLVWKPPKPFGYSRTHDEKHEPLWIIDGQQRATAFCLILGKKPGWWTEQECGPWERRKQDCDVLVKVVPPSKDNVEFSLPSAVRRQDPCWVSVREIIEANEKGELVKFSWRIVERLKESGQTVEEDALIGLLLKVAEIRSRPIVIVEIDHEVEDVAEIFARLNQAGVRVKEADTVFALAAVKNPGWARDKYRKFRGDLDDAGWDLPPAVIIRTIAAIGAGRARFKEVKSDFWERDSFTNAWEKTKMAISKVVKQLESRGIVNVALLPTKNVLIPVFVFEALFDDGGYNFNHVFHWLLLATKAGVYTGAAITTLNQDVKALHESPSWQDAIEKLRSRLETEHEMRPEDFMVRFDRATSRFHQLIIYLLLQKTCARDWIEKVKIGYDKDEITRLVGFTPNWHHIFPKALLRGRFSDEKIQAIANLTIVTSETNCKKLKDKVPSYYIPEYNIGTGLLKEHLIPEPFASNPMLMVMDNYENFLNKRAELLAQKANEFFASLLDN